MMNSGESQGGLLNGSLLDASNVLIFNSSNELIASRPENVRHTKEELSAIQALYSEGKDFAIKAGLHILGHAYEVHRYDLPLIYGRTAVPDAQDSDGFALYKAPNGPNGASFAFINFRMPQLTATMVPLFIDFCQRYFSSQSATGLGTDQIDLQTSTA